MGIKGLQTLYPCVALALAAAVLWFLYPLTDERHAELVREVHAREEVGIAGATHSTDPID